MWNRANRDKAAEAEHVLLIANHGAQAEPLAVALTRSGALVTACTDAVSAMKAARDARYVAVILAAREQTAATVLMLALLRSETAGLARIMLVASPDQALELGGAAFEADEVLLDTLPPGRIAAATGVGLGMEAEPYRLAG